MAHDHPQIDRFEQQLRDSLQRETQHLRVITLAKQAQAYTCGDQDDTVYFIESGQIKLLMLSTEGSECLLAIHTAGDMFGELCFSGLGVSDETAVAMDETILKQIPRYRFLALLGRDGLLEGFARYLVIRIAEQQQVIANLVTVNSEQRLGKTLLQLARKLGKKGLCHTCTCEDIEDICIEHKISHEELSEMVGTTRPRISLFMQQFRKLGLIDVSAERFLIVKEDKLAAYLAQPPSAAAFRGLPQPAVRQLRLGLLKQSPPPHAARQ